MRCGVAAVFVGIAAASGNAGLPIDPPCRALGSAPTHAELPYGVVSVETLGADPTGETDSTKALQAAFVKARTDNITLFVPLGCYKITDTILGVEPRDGRWQPIQIIGQNPTASNQRPTFVLPPATSGFTDAYKPMMSFWTDWCLAPGPEPAQHYNGSDCPHYQDRPPWLFNTVVQGLDFVIGEGNFGAVGLDMLAAQGSTVQDITVYAGPDALAGVAGGNGGGGVFVGITVVGGRYGLDARKAQVSSTYTSMRLINQTCAAMVVGPGVKATIAVIGLHVQGSPALGGVLAGVELPVAGSTCYAPTMPRVNQRVDSLSDSLSLIDVSFKLFSPVPCVEVNASLWMQNVFSEGCANVVVSAGKPILTSANALMHVEELASGRREHASEYRFPWVVDGSRSESLFADVDEQKASEDFYAKHHWGNAAPDFQSEGAVNALDLGATGDGVTDDWQALQSALDKHVIVVLPKGLYRLSRPLVMHRRGAALIGVGAARSFLMPLSRGFSPQEQPVLDMDAEGATVKGLTAVTWSHLATGYALRWSGTGVYRQAFVTREAESVFPLFQSVHDPHGIVPQYTASVSFNRPLVVVSGGGAFYDFDVDYGCCFGHVRVGGLDMTEEILLQRPNYRTLLINGSVAGLRFYPHNTEQSWSDAYTEIVHSFNVTLYNAKSENEGHYAMLWIRDSDLISVHGFGGMLTPFPNNTDYNDGSDVRNADLGLTNLSADWADLGTGRCVTETPPLFDGELLESGIGACQKYCKDQFKACGYISAGNGARCTIWPSSASCEAMAGGPGHSSSPGDVHSFAYTGGYASFMPSVVRVQRSTRITLANLNGETGGAFHNMILHQDGEGVCDAGRNPERCYASAPFDQPVLWRWRGETLSDLFV